MYVSHGVKPFLTYLWPPLLIDPRAAPDTRVSGRWVNEGTERRRGGRGVDQFEPEGAEEWVVLGVGSFSTEPDNKRQGGQRVGRGRRV